ncbi:MAG: alpha-galactosidase, partial [Draconibacterium sp.]
MKLKLTLLIISICFLFPLKSKSQLQAVLKNDTLILSNSLVERKFRWNGGELKSYSFTDKASSENLVTESKLPALNFSKHFDLGNTDFKVVEVEKTNVNTAGLKAEITLLYGSFKIKRVFRISENVPAIACDNFIFFNENIDPAEFETIFFKGLQLENIQTGFRYPYLKAVEFFDRTDENNNLVKEQCSIAYTHNQKLKGNILQATPGKEEGPGMFILKEAPCSFVQLAYPGYDFNSVRNNLTVEGIGISDNKITSGEWIQLYGTVIGCFDGTDYGFTKALRAYQNSLRPAIPERDEMIMMNTWGDRNNDASIGEAFLKGELDACEKLGISHFQIDDGWQQGLSQNSAKSQGNKWDLWDTQDWVPNKERLPNGLKPIVEYAKKKGVLLGLWFHPSNHNSYENWETDANTILNLYKEFDIRYFKIDGTQLPDKRADHRLRMLFSKVLAESNGNVVINLDATAGNRTGYFYMNTYGNIFLENRYSDWGNYYPHWTLRNLWQLSAYVPTKNLQIEFLNKWRNKNIYGEDNPLAPYAIPFEYQFAIT